MHMTLVRVALSRSVITHLMRSVSCCRVFFWKSKYGFSPREGSASMALMASSLSFV